MAAPLFSSQRSLYLAVDGPAQPCVFYTTRRGSGRESPSFVEGDSVLLSLYLCRRPSSYGVDAALVRSAGALILGIKTKPDPTLDYLAYTDTWTLVQDAVAGDHYTATLDLTNPAITDAINKAARRPITVRLEIEIQGTANASRSSYGLDVTLFPQTIGPDAPSIPPPPPSYPPAGALVTHDQLNATVQNYIEVAVPPAAEAAAKAAAATIPRVTDATATTLPTGSPATATLTAQDPDNPQNLTLNLGLPRGEKGAAGSGGGSGGGGEIETYGKNLVIQIATIGILKGESDGLLCFPKPFPHPPTMVVSIERHAPPMDQYLPDVDLYVSIRRRADDDKYGQYYFVLSAPAPASAWTVRAIGICEFYT